MGARPLGGRFIAALLAAAVVLAVAAPSAGAAERRGAFVTSFDGTRIWTHFFPADGAGPSNRQPTIMVGPGWSMSGETSVEGGGGTAALFGLSPLGTLHDAGYNILTWDPRGFGSSGGTVQIDDPRYEGRDTQALIDYVATQPEAQLDQSCTARKRKRGAKKRKRKKRVTCATSRDDPTIGMAGASYGGGIQLVSAALDKRIDAIAPTI